MLCGWPSFWVFSRFTLAALAEAAILGRDDIGNSVSNCLDRAAPVWPHLQWIIIFLSASLLAIRWTKIFLSAVAAEGPLVKIFMSAPTAGGQPDKNISVRDHCWRSGGQKLYVRGWASCRATL